MGAPRIGHAAVRRRLPPWRGLPPPHATGGRELARCHSRLGIPAIFPKRVSLRTRSVDLAGGHCDCRDWSDLRHQIEPAVRLLFRSGYFAAPTLMECAVFSLAPSGMSITTRVPGFSSD